jgi:rod shape-determining protein MreD
MIFTPSILVRVSLLLLVSLLVQAYLLSPVQLAGTVIWLLPACVVVFGLLGGGMTGAVTGFVLGILSDAITDSPLGSGALALLAAGYLAGAYRERRVGTGILTAGVACALGTLFADLTIGLLVVMLGQAGPLTWGVASELVIQALYGFLFGALDISQQGTCTGAQGKHGVLLLEPFNIGLHTVQLAL